MSIKLQTRNHPATWSRSLFLCFAVWLVFADQAQAGGIGDFAGPIEKVMETITGPVGKAVAIIGMALSGYYFITNKEDIAGGAKALLGTVFGICFTPQGRLLFRLVPLKPRTRGCGSGFWHTPRANECGEDSETFVKRNGDRTEDCFSGLTAQVRAMELIPTPQASDGEKGSRKQKFQNGNPSLTAYAAMWPTPCHRDSKTDYGDTEAGRKRMEHPRGKPLAHVAAPGGQLNPTWVEWLMGFPLGWTDLKHSATP
jgi:type IV secretion system protein VirB2